MKTIKAGIIGTGFIGPAHVEAARRLGFVEMLALCEAGDELAKANALNQATGGAAQLIGLGLLTPVALRVFDSPEGLFALCAVLFAIAAFQALWIGRFSPP